MSITRTRKPYMITLTSYGAHGSLVCRDEFGRFCTPPPGWRAMWLEAGRLQRAAELRDRLAADAAIHWELGDAHSEPFPSLTTPGQDAWTRKHVTPWMEV